MNNNAALHSAAKRLRYLLNHPVEPYFKNYSNTERLAASFAYEYALRILIDEFGESENYCALRYGNDPNYSTSTLNSIGS